MLNFSIDLQGVFETYYHAAPKLPSIPSDLETITMQSEVINDLCVSSSELLKSGGFREGEEVRTPET